MKKYLIIAIIMVACLFANAAPPTAITNYFAGTIRTPGVAFTNAGNSGLSTGIVYICIPRNILTNNEFTATMVTNDVRGFVSSVYQQMKDTIDGYASSNRFTSYTLENTIRYGTAGTNRTVYRAITEQQNITVTPSYESE